MLMLHGSASSTNDHCKSDPDVVDVGSLVDYPRRHCGQNPVSVANCFDDVNYVKTSRVFLFVGTHDQVSLPGTIENVDGLLAQMISEPQRSIKVVRDQAFGHQVPLRSTPHVGGTTAAGLVLPPPPPPTNNSNGQHTYDGKQNVLPRILMVVTSSG